MMLLLTVKRFGIVVVAMDQIPLLDAQRHDGPNGSHKGNYCSDRDTRRSGHARFRPGRRATSIHATAACLHQQAK